MIVLCKHIAEKLSQRDNRKAGKVERKVDALGQEQIRQLF